MHVKRQFLYYHLYPVFEGILPDIDLNHIMMLQYSMLLLGSFESKPVHNSDIIEAQKILNMYAVELSERDIPCRFVSHQITHMPQDVAKYKCGIDPDRNSRPNRAPKTYQWDVWDRLKYKTSKSRLFFFKKAPKRGNFHSPM